MKLTFLGSGTFFVTEQVTASAFLLEAEGKKLLIDCGPGTLTKLAQIGVKVDELDHVFITHFHPDHTSDLFPLFMNYRLSDVFAPGIMTRFPTFWGPKGISRFLSEYSHLSQLLSYDGWGKVKVAEYKPSFKVGCFAVKTYKVLHEAFKLKANAYALRFEIDGKIIVFSGDSAKCKGVEDACKNADIFVCDASYPKSNPVTTSHMNTTEISEISRKGHVKKLVLDHFYPQFSQFDLVAEVKERFDGEVVKAKDLDVIEL